jgi:glycosyltransferase involved in cell wall biosynthesis
MNKNLPESCDSHKKICMLAYSDYESDNRVRRYAESLARRGDKVDVISISTKTTSAPVETIGGVNVLRIMYRDHKERSKWSYASRMLRFLFASSVILTHHHRREPYDVIHIHNMPNFLIFAAWYPKLKNTRLILDIHDLEPELFEDKFAAKKEGRYVKAMMLLERFCMSFADHVIVSNHLWHGKLVSRCVEQRKCSVVVNCIDPALFSRRARTRKDGRFVIMFPGSFQWHQGLDIAIKAFALIHETLPKLELHFYGGGGGRNAQESLRRLADQLGLNGSVKFMGRVALDNIPDIIANADLGIVPKRADSFGNEAYSTKITEFMSQGVPVVVSRTKIDSFYFTDKLVSFFDSGDEVALANAIVELVYDASLRESLSRAGLAFVENNNWSHQEKEYHNLIDSLSERNGLKNPIKIITDILRNFFTNPLYSEDKHLPDPSRRIRD